MPNTLNPGPTKTDHTDALNAIRNGLSTPGGSDNTSGGGDSGSTPFDWSNNSFWNRDNDGLTVSPKGMGYGMGGLGALAGLMLPGKDTSWWKRLLYALAGAGLLGSAGYVGGGLLGEGKGWTLPGGLGKKTAPQFADADGDGIPDYIDKDTGSGA